MKHPEPPEQEPCKHCGKPRGEHYSIVVSTRGRWDEKRGWYEGNQANKLWCPVIVERSTYR